MYRRLFLSLLAIVGTGWYAYSFFPVAPREIALGAGAVGALAGISWLVLGAVLLVFARRIPTGTWFDLCLTTLARGMAFLLFAALLNTVAPLWKHGEIQPVVLHASLLLGSGTVMTSTFVALSQDNGVSFGRAMARWVVGLQLPFVMMMTGYVLWRWL